MDLETFRTLLSPAGQAALADAAALAPSEATFLRCHRRLEKCHGPALARAALETVLLRQRARAKFSRSDAMYFTREALEQASSEPVARHRAARFAPFPTVGDFCCGIGGDTVALAERSRVVAVDRDPLRLAMAAANLAALGLGERVAFHERDLSLDRGANEGFGRVSPDAIFFDPSRRPGGRRRLDVEEYEPPLSRARDWRDLGLPVGVKLAPGVDLRSLAGYGGEIEFVSLFGELKECVLWLGPLATAPRRATLLPGGHTLAADAVPAPTVRPPGAVLYDPDSAILRAGLVTVLASLLGAAQLDTAIALLSADAATPTPFAESFLIEESLPYSLKRLRDVLRARHIGRVEVRKRGSAVDVEEFVRQLKLRGDEARIVFLTRVAGKPWAFLTRPAESFGHRVDFTRSRP